MLLSVVFGGVETYFYVKKFKTNITKILIENFMDLILLRECLSHQSMMEKKLIRYIKVLKKKNTPWIKVSLEEVKNFTKKLFLDIEDFYFIKGRVENTLIDKKNLPRSISILRLDTDLYESTKIELEILYPLLIEKGILIIDDYGDFVGCRKAVDEYFFDKNVLMIGIDKSCRVIIKN